MREGVQLNGEHRVLTYTNDIALKSENINDTAALHTQITKEPKKTGLQVNMVKTQNLLENRTAVNPELYITINNTNFEQMTHLKYLGSSTVQESNIK